MAIIASWDWPERWPGLVENLTACLLSDDLNLVHGAMKTLDMFASGDNLTDLHIPLLVDIVFPQLQRIFGEESYPERIRMRAIYILQSIVSWLGKIKAEYPQSIAESVQPTLPEWYQLFLKELAKPDVYGTGHGSKIGVLTVLIHLITNFPDYIKDAIGSLLEPMWASLAASVEVWEKTQVYNTEEDDSGYDSDAGDEITYKNYLSMLVELFTVIDEKKNFTHLLTPGLIDLSCIMLRLAQLSAYQASLYDDDPSAFLMEEDEDDPNTFSLRFQACKLLQMIAFSLDGHGIEAINGAVHKYLQELNAFVEQGGDSNIYLLRRESLMYCVGSSLRSWSQTCEDITLSGTFPTGAAPSDVPFDVSGFIKVLMEDCESPNLIVRGRALWCASIAMRMLPEADAIVSSEERPEQSDEQVVYLLRNAVSALQMPEAPLPFLLHAASCVTELSALLDLATLKQTVHSVLPTLVSLAPNLEEASLMNLLSTIQKWIELDSESTIAHASAILDSVLESWSRNSLDPYLPSLIAEILQALCHIPEILPLAQEKVGQVILDVFADPQSRENGLVESCTDMMVHLFMDANWPLPQAYNESILPQFFHIMLNTVDNAMLQSGCRALVALVRCAKDSLNQLPLSIEDTSSDALEFTIMVIDRVLNSNELNDSAALYVGPLISKLIDTNTSVLGDRVFSILESVVLRLERVETPVLAQDLLQVFAQLLRQNSELVLEFLCAFHMPNSQENALSFVLSYWTKTFEDRHGNYQLKVSILALSTLFGHPSLADLQVPADAALEDAMATADEAIGMRTRSKRRTGAEVPRTESLNVRIFRLMLREHMWLLEEQDAPNEMSSDEDEFSIKRDEEEDGASPFAPADKFLYAQDYGGTISLDRLLQRSLNLDDEETDPDILSDPAYQLDLEQYIYDWMKHLATENVEMFDYCVSQLSSIERNHLIHRLIQSRP